MKLLEGFVYSLVVFVGAYAIIAVAMRVFELATTFYAHVTGGIVATVLGVGTFVLVLLKKK